MIIKRIKELRKKANLSQNQLASKTGLTVTSIANLEQGVVKEPSIQTMFKIADALNVSLDELVGRKFKSSKK